MPSAITADGKPDVYWLVVSGVRPLIDAYGKDSPAVKEALSLLNDALTDVSKAFMDVYSDKVAIELLYKIFPLKLFFQKKKKKRDEPTSNFVFRS